MEEECTSCNHHWATLRNEPELSEPELPDIPLKQHEGQGSPINAKLAF